jgi:predicted lipoprotein with Yx(FWY)xxD motif
MANYKPVAMAFIVLTVLFGATTGYMLANPTTKTVTSVSTQVSTTTTTLTSTGTISPVYSVGVAYKSGVGFYLTNGTGFSLYFRTTDKPYNGTTTCTSSICTANWPAFYTAKLTVPPGINASSFGTITLANGNKQLTYDGYPLYYWHMDTQPGQDNGQGIGDFYLCTLPTPAAPSTTTINSTSTSTSSSA